MITVIQSLVFPNIHFGGRILTRRPNIILNRRVCRSNTHRVIAKLTYSAAGLLDLMDSLFSCDFVYIGKSGIQCLDLNNFLNQGLHVVFVLLSARFEYVGIGSLNL